MKKLYLFSVSLVFYFFSTSAMAIPAEATTAITAMTSEVSDAEAAVWPVIGASMLAVVIIKLVKRFVGRI